jgi:multidrug efflux system outer membrane protein
LVAEVGTSYIQLRVLDQQLSISKSTLKSYKDSLKYFELQYKYGQVSLMTIEQVRSQYETAAIQIPQIERQIAETENALSVLLGRNPGPIARGRAIADLTIPPVPKGLPSQLLEQRPDILQAEQQLIAANAEIGAAKAQYFPTVTLTGNYGKVSDALSTIFNSASTTWNYGGSIVGPIFTAGAIEGQVLQASAAAKAAELNYKLTIQQAFADINNALISRNELEKQMKAEKKRVHAYSKYKDLAWKRYNGGYSPYIEVLYAETQLYPAELSAVQSQAATLISLINIYKALGGGWVDAAAL